MRQNALHPPARTVWIQVDPLPKDPARKRQDDDTQRRIVQSNAGHESKEAAPDAYLGEKTRVVDRETVNKNKVIAMGKAAEAKPARQQQAKAERRAQPKADARAETKSAALSNLGLAILPEARRKGAAEELAKDTPEWANIGAQPQDYVEGVHESDRTALNTREYLYYGYHQRIRQRLELEWTRLLRDVLVKFYRGGRQLASETDYTTRVMVVLNSRGEITRIKVTGQSGTQELDDVAVSAFNKAGPFPNPPKGLVRNGEVEVPWELKLRS